MKIRKAKKQMKENNVAAASVDDADKYKDRKSRRHSYRTIKSGPALMHRRRGQASQRRLHSLSIKR
jgi:hypothetical protein